MNFIPIIIPQSKPKEPEYEQCSKCGHDEFTVTCTKCGQEQVFEEKTDKQNPGWVNLVVAAIIVLLAFLILSFASWATRCSIHDDYTGTFFDYLSENLQWVGNLLKRIW